jgi:hypothetical protein
MTLVFNSMLLPSTMIIAVPDPITPPVMLCDVETGSPRYVAVKTHVIPAREADKVAYKSSSGTTPLPSVFNHHVSL